MITVLIPAYNEALAIEGTVRAVRAVLDDNSIEGEILVVDDGSKDRTGEIAKETGAIVIRHPHNVGYGRALKAGITNATHDTIVIIDADLTYPVGAIPLLLDEYRKGHDMVVGARTGEHYHESWLKSPLRHILKALVQYTAERPVPDVNSGLRIFSKTKVLKYLPHLCDTFSFTTSLTLAYMMTGQFVAYVPIEYEERVGTTKVKLFKDSLRTLQYIAQAMVYYNPLRMFVLVSGLCVILGLTSFIVGAITQLHAPYYLGIGALLIALMVFCLGLLADLLRQIMAK